MDNEQHRDYRYTTPRDLRITTTPVRRALVIGSCATGNLPAIAPTLEGATPIDFFNVNHGCFLPDAPPRPMAEYDFQIIQIPIRTIVPEARLMRLSYDDVAGHQALFDDAVAKLGFSVDNALRWTRESGVPAFVTNFAVPQQNPFGRFLPRYDIRNFVHFTELLNQRLAGILAEHRDAYLLDLDQLCGVFGRKNFQDDATTLFVHGAFLNDYDFSHDQHRLEAVPRLTQQYGAETHHILGAIWEEACAMFRTLRQTDSLKVVIVDLDDTLWRGVVAEGAEITSHTTEGWPVGFVKALLYLKRRGVLLAIASKNDRGRVEALWSSLYGGRLELSDFAAVRINWQFKAENVAEILAELNLLPRNAVFIDDNPVEREAVRSAFPDIRVLGANPYVLRRILLWSPELQVPRISAEALRRTEMIQSQGQREAARKAMSRAEFLASVAPKVTVFAVSGPDDPKFARSFELLNKTNQFNSTGRRWTTFELQTQLQAGGALYAFEVEDRYTQYGLVGVLIVHGSEVVQFVMSCRVLGLDVELAVLAHLVDRVLPRPITARLVETDANTPIRDLYTRAGFAATTEGFRLDEGAPMPSTEHVTLVSTIGSSAAEQSKAAPVALALVGPNAPEQAPPAARGQASADRPTSASFALPDTALRLVPESTRQNAPPSPAMPQDGPQSAWDLLRAGPLPPPEPAKPALFSRLGRAFGLSRSSQE